jgi:hypothetical protein
MKKGALKGTLINFIFNIFGLLLLPSNSNYLVV